MKVFFKFVVEALKDFKSNFILYLRTYLLLLLINFLMIIPWEGLGYQDKSVPEVILSIFAGLLSLVCITNIIYFLIAQRGY